MPEIPFLHEQYRHSTGLHTRHLDSNARSQHYYDRYINRLAARPGLHRNNIQRQMLAPALLQFIAGVSNIRFTPDRLIATREAGAEQQALIPQLTSVSHPPDIMPEPVRSRRDLQATTAAQPLVKQDVISLAEHEAEMLIFKDQRKRLDKFLERKSSASINYSYQRLNTLIKYLQRGDVTQKTNTIAKRLIKSADGFYTNKKGVIAESWKRQIITEFIIYETLGMRFNEWAMTLKFFEHGPLQDQLLNVKGLNKQARQYYQHNILHKVLPTATLNLSEAETEQLSKMSILQPEWGFLHAGALLLSESRVELNGLTLSDILEVGLLLDMLLRSESVPAEYAEYFRLPALLHHKFNVSGAEDKRDGELLQDYFNHTQQWIQDNDPLFVLNKLAKSWKTRRELATELLFQYQVSRTWLIRWLNYHAPMPADSRSGRIMLPDIDALFDQQNSKLAEANRQLEKLLIEHAFETLDPTEQQFILRAKVERVSAEFNAMASLYGIPLPPQARVAMSQSGALIYRVADNVEIIKCTAGSEVRIYVLDERKNGEWRFNRVDFDREKVLELLADKSVPAADTDYKLKFNTPVLLKQTSDPLPKIIEQLGRLRYDKLFKLIGHAGYEKTNREKAKDFLLSLVPFYTCVSQSIKGNVEEALPACAMDMISLLPFVGTALTTGTRFGVALTRSASLALRYSAQQAGLNQLFKNSATTLIKQFATVAHEISPSVMRKLGMHFISAVDPGFNLLMLGGKKGILTLEKIVEKIAPRHRGIERLSGALYKKTQTTRHLPSDIKIKTIYSQLHGKDVDVTMTGLEKGRQIWVRVDAQTGQLFGRKYIRNDVGFLEPAPVKLANRLYQVQTEGLGGRGSKLAATAWGQSTSAKDQGLLIPSQTTTYNDFTISQYNLLVPPEQKELIILAHGRLRSRFRKIASSPVDLYFYSALNKDFEASNAEILKFQTRRATLPAQEIVARGEEVRDYELQFANAPFEDKYAKFRYHSRFLNSDIASGSNQGKPLHDVLIIKKDHTLALSKLVKELPPYSKIHCLFCRTRAMP